jgi:phosphonate transport system substrate-binding protein
VASITVAVVPSSLPGDRVAALDAVCIELSKLMRADVRGAVPATYAELARWLEHDRVQYAWMSPALMVLTSERIHLAPLLMAVRNERTEYCSALFVDGRKAASSVGALRGKTIAWVDPTSASGYLVPRIHLAARGLDTHELFGKELFVGSHAAVVRAVFEGIADVGATYAEQPEPGQPITRAGFRDVAPDHPVRVLEWTQAIPNDVIVGHGLLGRAEHRVFSNAILTLAERDDGRRLLHAAFHADRFTTMPRTALRPLWALVELARKNGLLAQL